MYSDGRDRRLDRRMPEPLPMMKPHNLPLPLFRESVPEDPATTAGQPAQIGVQGVPTWRKNKVRLPMEFFWPPSSHSKGNRRQGDSTESSAPGLAASMDLPFPTAHAIANQRPLRGQHASRFRSIKIQRSATNIATLYASEIVD